MKVGDAVKLKPAMWQGIKPESYGLSFTGEYIVEQYIDMQYPAIKLEGFNGKWDAQAFQVVVKGKEKEVNKFKVGDKVVIDKEEWKEHGLGSPANYDLSFENIYRIERTTATLVWVDGSHISFHYDFFKLAEKEEAVHSPKHYAVFDDVEAIEIIARSMTKEMFKGYCFGNLLKYRLRAGNKDDVKQELGKADKYKELYEKYKDLCQ